jgi:hypothetical protein
MELEPKRDEGLFATAFYFVFIPSYVFLSYHAIGVAYRSIFLISTDSHVIKLMIHILVMVSSLYYPIILVVFLIWAFRYKSKIKAKQVQAIWLWMFGGIIFIVVMIIILYGSLMMF